MSYSGFNIPKKEDKKTISSRAKYKISLIVSEWNSQITNKLLEGTWKMVGKETHLDCKSIIVVIKIEPNGDLNLIARIRNSKREEIAKDPQKTLKKIK